MGPFKEKQFNYIYKVICNITGKYYIGMHSTDKLDDGYIGSGYLLKKSIIKHGKENHTKQIIQFFENRSLLEEAEKSTVTENILLDPLCLNLKTGGENNQKFSQTTLNKLKKSPEQRQAISNWRKGKATFITKEQIERQSKLMTGENNPMHHLKRTRPVEWCINHSKIMKEKYSNGKHPGLGKPNINLGRICCVNPITNKTKTITIDLVDEYSKNGWIIGKRKLNVKKS